MVARFNNLFAVRKMLALDFEGKSGIKSRNRDRVTVITGYEGTGKSNLLLHMFKFWVEELLGENITADHVKYIGDNKKTFISALHDAKRYMLVGHDEAGKDLYSRDSMSAFNKDLNKAYIVIRGLNLNTVLVIPSLMDLETYFRKRRVTQMYHVYQTGKIAYFPKNRLRQLAPKMAMASKYNDDPDPMRLGIKPLFTDTFPKYPDDALYKAYLERKQNNMEEVKNELYAKYVTGDGTDGALKVRNDLIFALKNKGVKREQIARISGLAPTSINRICQNIAATKSL